MVDITKCTGENCHLKNKCYRFRSKPGRLQSYFIEIPIQEDNSCDYFISADGFSNLIEET